MRISRKRSSPFFNVPLSWVLVVPLIVQIVGVIGLVGYFSYRSGQTALENMANRVRDQANSRIRDHLNTSLAIQRQAVALSQIAIQNGNLNINDFEELQKYFWKQINLSPSLGSIYFANEKAEMIGYGRLLSQEAIDQTRQLTGENLRMGEVVLLQTTPQARKSRKYYLINDQGKAKKLYGNLPVDNRTTRW